MTTSGIIAEYNPFHNGHGYHLRETKKQTQSDYTVVVMSGDFVQRGIPAMLDKYTRTRMALAGGADVVFELPCIYATSSAELFSEAAVGFFQQTGVIDILSFGAENASLDTLSRIARILNDEPQGLRALLQENLREGYSYPRAVYAALTRFMLEESRRTGSIIEEVYRISSQLALPNNILGIEYLKALMRLGCSIRPYCMERKGSGYNTTLLKTSEFGSSGAIRLALESENGLSVIRRHIPEAVYDILESSIGRIGPIAADDLSTQLNYALLSKDALTDFADMTAELAARIRNLDAKPRLFSEWADAVKTKNVTLAHVSRALLHVALGIRKEDIIQARSCGMVPYARILGFRESAAPLLKKLKENSAVPVITKIADAGKRLGRDAAKVLELELRAHEIYRQMVYACYKTVIPDEYRAEIVRMS